MPTHSMPTHSMPTQYASQYASPYAYTVCLIMPIPSILDTDPHLLVSFTISNLKKKLKFFMTSLLENCFFSMPTHSMPTQYASQHAS